MIQLIHTSDWHLGATLHGASRLAEHERFLDWLTDTIRREETDVLVIAGDIFDRRQPSTEALRLYYHFLVGLKDTGLSRVVILGGNHDSPSQLDAPRELLDALNVSVIGGWNGSTKLSADEPGLDRHIIPLSSRDGQTPAVLLGVPYVHEWALGVRTTGQSASSLGAELTARFSQLYTSLCDRALRSHPGATLIATGHLTAVPTKRGDSPREMPLIGHIEGLKTDIFDARIAYVALGHIHRPMSVAGTKARYSGSPIAIGPQEAAVQRQIVALGLSHDGTVESRAIDVPLFRDILSLSGEIDEVCAELVSMSWSTPLPPYVIVEVLTEAHSPGNGDALLEALSEGFKVRRANAADDVDEADERVELIHWHETRIGRDDQPEERAARLQDLGVEEVFRLLCERQGEVVDDALLGALREAMELAEVGS